MLQKGYRVKVNQTDKVGFVTSSGQTLVVKETEGEATPFNNPNLPDTKAQIIVPLRTGENIIGALDLQSDRPIEFNASSIDAFNLLADQISIAIQGARSFEETRNALIEAQVAYRQSATTSWRDVLHQGTRGYRYLNGNIEAVKDEKSSARNQTVEKSIQRTNESLIIPINIRGKSLGTLNIHQAGRTHAWSGSEIRVYQSIVDRISFALENARLYQDAQRRAAKERVISEIATRVSSSVNMDNILQTAVEELGRVLPGSEIVIQFEHEQDETGSEFTGQE
jgi:GAF domain-containing protein